MKFTPSDIHRLYGKQLFMLPDAPAVLEENHGVEEDVISETQEIPEETLVLEPAFLTEGSVIAWKMKPDAQFALILRPDEFSNKELTSLLKKAILDAGINTKMVGFGVMEQESSSWNIANMPVNVGVFLEEAPVEKTAFKWKDKQVYFVNRLARLKESTEGIRTLTETLSQIHSMASG